MKRARATSNATRQLSTEEATGTITMEQKMLLRSMIANGDPKVEDALDQAALGNADLLKELASSGGSSLRSRLQQLSSDGLLPLRFSRNYWQDLGGSGRSSVAWTMCGNDAPEKGSRTSRCEPGSHSLAMEDTIDLEALLKEMVEPDVGSEVREVDAAQAVDELSTDLGHHLYLDPNVRHSLQTSNSLDLGLGHGGGNVGDFSRQSILSDMMHSELHNEAVMDEPESPRKRSASECSSQRSMISDAASEGFGERPGKAGLLLAQSRARESTKAFGGSFEIIDNYFVDSPAARGIEPERGGRGSSNAELQKDNNGSSGDLRVADGGGRGGGGRFGENITTFERDLDAIERSILSALDEDGATHVEDGDVSFEGIFDFADMSSDGMTDDARPRAPEGRGGEFRSMQRSTSLIAGGSGALEPENRSQQRKKDHGTSKVSGALKSGDGGAEFGDGGERSSLPISDWPFPFIRKAGVNNNIGMASSTWHVGAQASSEATAATLMPMRVNQMRFVAPQSLPAHGYFGFQNVPQPANVPTGSDPDRQQHPQFTSLAPHSAHASWHAGMGFQPHLLTGVLPSHLAMLQNAPMSMRRSDGGSNDMPRESGSSCGGDPGRALRVAGLSDRADILQERGVLTPHQRGIAQIIFRRGDDYLCTRFDEAMADAEAGKAGRLTELLRMAERLRGSVSSAPEGASIHELRSGIFELVTAVRSSKASAVKLRNAKQFNLALTAMKQMKEEEKRLAAYRGELERREKRERETRGTC